MRTATIYDAHHATVDSSGGRGFIAIDETYRFEEPPDTAFARILHESSHRFGADSAKAKAAEECATIPPKNEEDPDGGGSNENDPDDQPTFLELEIGCEIKRSGAPNLGYRNDHPEIMLGDGLGRVKSKGWASTGA